MNLHPSWTFVPVCAGAHSGHCADFPSKAIPGEGGGDDAAFMAQMWVPWEAGKYETSRLELQVFKK